MDVSVSVSCFHDEIASTVERALKAAVDTVLWEITKTVGGRFAEKEKENEKLKLRLEMSERELRAMRECLIMSATRSPPSAASFSRTVQNYTEDGTGTCVRVREPLNDPRVAEDRAFAAEQRPVLIEEVETKENFNCDEIGERTITGSEAGWAEFDSRPASVEMRAVRIKEETGGSVCIEEETPHLQPAEPGPLHLLEEAFELTCSAVAQASPGGRCSPARDREAEHSGSGIRIPHPCPDCGKHFVELGPLKRHRRTHARKTPYPCAECGKRFSQKGALQDHLRIHTGERPYRCGECGRSFTRVDGLRIHQRIHTGEKPYRCEACGKRFNQLSAFKTHLRIHTGEKPYRCEACGATLTYSQQLKAHRCQGPANSGENSHSDRADWKTPPHYGL